MYDYKPQKPAKPKSKNQAPKKPKKVIEPMDFNTLNKEQRQAVESIDGPLLLLAGAGSGKTRVITYRIANLIKNKGIPARWVLALTFTNKAAQEMGERVKELLGTLSRGILVTTFHSLCVRILRQYIPILGYEANFVIFDTTAQLQCMKTIMEEHGLDSSTANVKAVFYEIMKYKGDGQKPADLLNQTANPANMQMGKVYQDYNKLLKSCNALDFEDILYLTLDLIQKHHTEVAELQDRYHYIMVDEYQDTNRVQYKIVSFLCEKRKQLCVVGDDDQSIYGWRGADQRNILDFKKDFPDVTTIKLEQNYRSTDVILRAANSVISNNTNRMEKTLWTDTTDGPKVKWVFQLTAEEELQEVVQRLRHYRLSNGKFWKDCAFLYRSNFQSRVIEEALRNEGIPYQLIGGTKFFDRKEIQDCLSYMRFLHNPKDEISLFRILNYPRRGLGQAAITGIGEARTGTDLSFFEIMSHASSYCDLGPRELGNVEAFAMLLEEYIQRLNTEPFYEVCKDLFERVGLKEELERTEKVEEAREKKVNNYLEFLNTMYLYGQKKEATTTLSDFLEYVSLFTDQDTMDDKKDQVSLMTVHGSKGLEFDFVALVGLTDKQFPSEKSVIEGNLEEERRLFYVAITRARHALILSMSETRRYYGEEQRNLPSRFLEEIDPSVFEIPPFGKATVAAKKVAAKNARAAFFDKFKKNE